jgi:hypothetical protein
MQVLPVIRGSRVSPDTSGQNMHMGIARHDVLPHLRGELILQGARRATGEHTGEDRPTCLAAQQCGAMGGLGARFFRREEQSAQLHRSSAGLHEASR